MSTNFSRKQRERKKTDGNGEFGERRVCCVENEKEQCLFKVVSMLLGFFLSYLQGRFTGN